MVQMIDGKALDVRSFGVSFFPSPEELLPFYQAALESGDAALMAEVERVAGDCFAIDAEDLPAFCEA